MRSPYPFVLAKVPFALGVPAISLTGAQAGLLARQHFETGKAVFELNQGGHHDHLVCLQCGRVEEFFDAEIEKLRTKPVDAATLDLAIVKIDGNKLTIAFDRAGEKRERRVAPAYRGKPVLTPEQIEDVVAFLVTLRD